jgi:replicative DNA helicase
LAIVDYFQLLKNSGSKFQRHDVLADISGRLRALSLDLNIPIIPLAQINRESERSADKRPTVANLGGTTALENDATMVILGYRPGACDPPVICDENGVEFTSGYSDFTIAKGRNQGRSRHVCHFHHAIGFTQAAQGQPFTANNSFSAIKSREEEMPF